MLNIILRWEQNIEDDLIIEEFFYDLENE